MSLSVSAGASGFTVTCPSNSNMISHPHNLGSNYTVKLPKPLCFSGQTLNEDVHWQVAMLSVHYTHNFYNFREPCTIYMVVEAPVARPANAERRQSPECFSLGTALNEGEKREEVDTALIRLHLAESAVVTKSTVVLEANGLLGKVKLPAKHYAGIAAICDEIVSQFDKIFVPRHNIQLQYVWSNDRRITFSLSNGQKLTMYTVLPYIANVLGLETMIVTLPAEVCSSGHAIDIRLMENIGTRSPKLGGIQALYIYTDIVEYQVVGDTLAPLLAYVDVEKSPGERVGHICRPLVYLPVNKSLIDSIGIRICDEHGNEINFPDDVENVVVRLHFRKAKHVGLL